MKEPKPEYLGFAGEEMKPLTEIKQGCGKDVDLIRKRVYCGTDFCGSYGTDTKKIRLCPSCQALLTQTEEIIKEIDNWKENYNLNHDNFAGEQIEEEDYQELRQKIIGVEKEKRRKGNEPHK